MGHLLKHRQTKMTRRGVFTTQKLASAKCEDSSFVVILFCLRSCLLAHQGAPGTAW